MSRYCGLGLACERLHAGQWSLNIVGWSPAVIFVMFENRWLRSVYIPLFLFFICSHQMKNGISTSMFHFSFFIRAKILKRWHQKPIFHFLLKSENRKWMRLHINSIFHREWKMENEKWKIEWRHCRNSIFHFMRVRRPYYCVNLWWYLWLWCQSHWAFSILNLDANNWTTMPTTSLSSQYQCCYRWKCMTVALTVSRNWLKVYSTRVRIH